MKGQTESLIDQYVREEIQKEIDREMIGIQEETDQFKAGLMSMEDFLKKMDVREQKMKEIMNKLQGLTAAWSQGVR